MIQRRAEAAVERALGRQAAVALLGPRQVGKTTLALALAARTPSLYLDLESRSDRAKLEEPELFLGDYSDRLVILDEIHRAPELFATLRGLIDRGRREGRATGRFLVLGSASMDLLRQSGESLAGRIEFVHLAPFDVLEVGADAVGDLWLRGGFPGSFLASSEDDSYAYRASFIRTYLARDVREFAPRIPAETLERLWTMLAHSQGAVFNASTIASGLAIASSTAGRYVDLLADLMVVRRLQPIHANVLKRLVRSPRVYVRDTGLLHALLGLPTSLALSGHPVVGPSWESFVIENVLSVAPLGTIAGFYRTAAGAEVDLVLDLPGGMGRWAIESKRGLTPRLERGFHVARADLAVTRGFVVYSGKDRYPIAAGVEAISLHEMCTVLAAL